MQATHHHLRLTAAALAALVSLGLTAGTALLFDTRGQSNMQHAVAANTVPAAAPVPAAAVPAAKL